MAKVATSDGGLTASNPSELPAHRRDTRYLKSAVLDPLARCWPAWEYGGLIESSHQAASSVVTEW